jgi:hypothetical protein
MIALEGATAVLVAHEVDEDLPDVGARVVVPDATPRPVGLEQALLGQVGCPLLVAGHEEGEPLETRGFRQIEAAELPVSLPNPHGRRLLSPSMTRDAPGKLHPPAWRRKMLLLVLTVVKVVQHCPPRRTVGNNHQAAPSRVAL